ncbi:hypothetical protein B9Z55_016861 [Caenorhabditis nigoni]|uniref:PDZ domain-containing protein n=1 Tax=Caenorhabditis nigoni TaxID=1611254 RepID=A0A2G5T724_9PELO|nr:hypothetical protein B9Z55_016861 [Caenorhabditis nigoni]
MTTETLNLSRETKRAFRAGKFPEHIIKKDMIREMTCTIDCAPGTPNYKEFKVTEGMLFQKVPDCMTPPLEYCDHLLKINGKAVATKREMQEAIFKLAKSNKAHYLTFTFRRIISVIRLNDRDVPSNAAILKPDSDPSDVSQKTNKGYIYYKVVLIYFPRSKLGMSVKSYQNVVYVESTDNTWGSTTRRFLYLGDAILKVDDTEINDVMTAQGAIRSGFQKNGTVTLIVERANQQLSSSFVRAVLNFNKEPDPSMPADVIAACAEQLARYDKTGFTEPVSIYRGYTKSYKTAARATVTKKVDKKNIRSEHLFPGALQKVSEFKENQRLEAEKRKGK